MSVMEEEEGAEQLMSEVHLGCPPGLSGPHISHFTFPFSPSDVSKRRYNDDIQVEVSSRQRPSLDNDGDLILMRRNADSLENNHAHSSDLLQAEYMSNETLSSDNDGDLVLTRRTNDWKGLCCGLTIQHNITSSLPSVGLQVWKAALVLADFVLHKIYTSSQFNGITALELGAGTGLVGIALAPVARTIFLTDIGFEVLDNCAANVHLNSSMLNFKETSVRVRELNWKELWPPLVGTSDLPSNQRSRYSWSSSEIEEADGATLLLAADVIYSDELTDSFFSVLEGLMSRGPEKILYLALEKRYNFALDDLDVVANGYSHFRGLLKDEDGVSISSLPYFTGEQIDLVRIPQYIREYERGKDLEMWKIVYRTKNFSSDNVS